MNKYVEYIQIKGYQDDISDTLRNEIILLLKEHVWETVKKESRDINDDYEFEVREEQIFDFVGDPYVKFTFTLKLIED